MNGYEVPRRKPPVGILLVLAIVILASIAGILFVQRVVNEDRRQHAVDPDEAVIQQFYRDGLRIFTEGPIDVAAPLVEAQEDTAAFGRLVESVGRVNAAENVPR